jgi:hypothetical protein
MLTPPNKRKEQPRTNLLLTMSLDQFARKHPRLIKQLRQECMNQSYFEICRDPVMQEIVKDLYFDRSVREEAARAA